MKKDKYQKTIYNLVHLSKADMTDDGVYIDRKKLQEDINVLWELYNNYQKLLDKKTPKKVKLELQHDYVECHYVCSYELSFCPECGSKVDFDNNYCSRCSQALDWGDENGK